MAKSFEPKKDAGDVQVLSYQHPERGLVEIKKFPHEAKDGAEEAVLESHPLFKETKGGGS